MVKIANEDRLSLIHEYKDIIDVRDLLARYGAHSMGIGYKIVDGFVFVNSVIRVAVRQVQKEIE